MLYKFGHRLGKFIGGIEKLQTTSMRNLGYEARLRRWFINELEGY